MFRLFFLNVDINHQHTLLFSKQFICEFDDKPVIVSLDNGQERVDVSKFKKT